MQFKRARLKRLVGRIDKKHLALQAQEFRHVWSGLEKHGDDRATLVSVLLRKGDIEACEKRCHDGAMIGMVPEVSVVYARQNLAQLSIPHKQLT